ncbi:MAG: helix-turn-helix transcriptional regulator [Gammaproteobacteria bacterium]
MRALVDARVAQGYTLHALAKRMGYGYNTVHRWENEQAQPPLRSLRDWANALGFDVQLFTLPGEQSRQ